MRKRGADPVLVLYNLPRAAAPLREQSQRMESEYGVLHEVSAVASALGHMNIPFRIAGARSLLDLPAILSAAQERLIFNLVEALHPDAPAGYSVPAICESFGKSCTGSDTACQLLAMDKWQSKAVLQAAGLPTPDGALIPLGGSLAAIRLSRGPYIVKPALTDASEGIDADSVVRDIGPALRRAIARVHRHFRQPALVEQMIGRRELNVSLLQRGRAVELLAIAEIDFSAFPSDRPPIVDYAAKWLEESFEYLNTPRILPARLTDRQREEVERLALTAWRALKCRDYTRVDLRLTEQGHPVILEVNPNPDIAPESGFAAALQHAGWRFEQFVKVMLRNAQNRLPETEWTYRARKLPPAPVNFTVRRVQAADRDSILGLLRASKFFRPDEIDIARDVLDTSIAKGAEGHYQTFVADERGKTIGWISFGPASCALGTFDIYWIAVAPRRQRYGIGKALLQYAEMQIRQRGGRLSVIETSSRSIYDATRQFYVRLGYREAAVLRNFYAPGDDKVIYLKALN
jgi:D-alanine-D-alanine ligase